ncbi:MAG TPA: hypothetical protein VNE61_10060 [Ktedonobacteraceae bacterium]|nr:hypothetical protein [Ktedonobacteraceae bacterium]
MPTDEALEATYKVRYFVDLPLIPPQDDKLPKMDYTQAINVATRWVKDGREIDIFDGSLPIFHAVPTGVEFVKVEPSHALFLEHLKIKIALDKVWGELTSKHLQ